MARRLGVALALAGSGGCAGGNATDAAGERPAARDDTAPPDETGSTDADTGPADTGPADTGPADTDTDTDPADTGLPAGTGLAGGWTIEHAGTVNGARFVHPVNTDKDGAIVAARVASALGGRGIPATSDARAAALTPTRMSDATYADEVATFVVDDLYGRLAGAGRPDQGLLTTDTLVLTSVHRYGLYVAEALHARVLPLQVLSFAERWDQVEAAATRATVIVGQDYDYGGLWLWSKLAAGAPGTGAATLPPAYLAALAEAEEVVIVQPDDNWTTCTDAYCWDVVAQTYDGGEAPIYLHTSLTRSTAANTGTARYAEAVAAGLVSPAPDADVANLKQWEWGVPDSTVQNVRAAWAALGKPPEKLRVIRGGVVDMFAWTPRLWEAYLARNGVAPRGAHFSSYWVAPTQLERAGAVLPFPSYSYWQEAWHPLDDNARAVLDAACGGAPCAPAWAAESRAFVNAIGSAGDPDGVRAVMSDYGLTAENGAWFGVGINAEGAGGWTGWNGEPVATAWEQVATDVQDPDRAPYADRAWTPLTVADICALGLYACE